VDDDGPYESRDFHVELLTEHAGLDGGIYLRASDQAINVLIGALDADIESAAEAVDAKMDSLVRRGMWSEAVLTAEHARYRSIQYAELIRREIVATRQNVAEVDWAERVLPSSSGRWTTCSAATAQNGRSSATSPVAETKRRNRRCEPRHRRCSCCSRTARSGTKRCSASFLGA